jgi:hypothetical protein
MKTPYSLSSAPSICVAHRLVRMKYWMPCPSMGHSLDVMVSGDVGPWEESGHRSLLNRASCRCSHFQDHCNMNRRCTAHGSGNEEVEVSDYDTEVAG